MLVKCPKCGFDQPKDTYCASCGVEMDTYKPVSPPLWKKVVRSPLFSLVIFLALGYASILYLKSPTPSPSSPSLSPRPSLPTASPETPSPVAPEKDASPAPSEPGPVEIRPHAAAEAPPKTTAIVADPMLVSPPPSPEPPVAEALNELDSERPSDSRSSRETSRDERNKDDQGPLALSIRFIEIPTELAGKFQSESTSEAQGSSGEMSFAIVKDAKKWLHNSSLVELDRLTKRAPEVSKKLQWFSGVMEEPTIGAPFGLNFQISIQEREGKYLAGELFIFRSLTEETPGGTLTTRKEFMTHFETEVGSLIGLMGVLPRTPVKTEDKDWLLGSFLKIFLSPSFLQGKTEFLILLQFNRDS